MALSIVEICNSALHKIGANRITSLTDTSKSAIIINDQYDRLRKEVLRSHPWNFAIAYISLAATVNTPIWTDYTFEFLLPSDVLRVLNTNLTSDDDWEVGYNNDGNKVIFCNSDTLIVRYIKDVENTTRFDACFDEALSFRIAADIAYALVQSQTVQTNMFNMYKAQLAIAMSFDAQEKSQDVVSADSFIEVRG